MAKVEYINAILSGKVAGNVYSRNRAGAYVRQWVRPINPRTNAQQQNRINFGNVSNQYHSLDNAGKALWNAFSAIYNPKGVTMPSSISGFNAFVGMGNTALSAHKNQWTFDVKKNGTGSPLTKTNEDFTQTSVAPSHMLITNIKTDGGFTPLVLNPADQSINLTSGGAITFAVSIPAVTGPTAGMGVVDPMTDSNGQKYGLSFFISNPKQQAHNFTKNPDMQGLGSIPHFNLAAVPTAISTYQLVGTAGVDPGDYQGFPSSGEIVELHIWQTGINGMLNKIFSKQITVS